MKIRGLILQGLLSIILVYLLFVPLGDANLIYLLFDEIPHQLNLPQYSFIIIFVIPFFVLIFTKNNKRTLLQIFAISQVIVLLITCILFICIFTHALYFLLMMGISFLSIIVITPYHLTIYNHEYILSQGGQFQIAVFLKNGSISLYYKQVNWETF